MVSTEITLCQLDFFAYYYGLIQAVKKALFVRKKGILKEYERT